MIRHTGGHRGIKLLKDDPKVNLYKFHSFCEGCQGLVSRVGTWVDILNRKPFFEPLDQIFQNCQISPFFRKNLAKNGRCQGLRPDGELIGDWPETITGRWTGGGGEEAAIGLRKVITQPMLKY